MKRTPRQAPAERGVPRRGLAWQPWSVVAVYVVAASVWVLVSDRIVRVSVGNAGTAEAFASAKGLVFVAITAGLLYLLLRHLGREALMRRVLPTTVFESAGFGIAISDAHSRRLIAVNQAFAQARGRRRGDFAGWPVARLFPEDREADLRRLIDSLDEGEHGVMESENLRADGSHFPVRIDATVVRDAAGAARYCIAFVFDLSESRKTEQALADSERRYRDLFDHSPIGKLVCDGERIVMANERASDMFRAGAPAQLVGRSLLELVPESRRGVVLGRLERFRDTGEPVPLQQDRALRLDGQEIDVEFMASPLLEGGRRLMHVILQDVSERSALEREIIEISTAEQARIGREIHDGICQQLLATDLMVLGLERRMARDGADAQPLDSLRQIAAQIEQALGQARALANGSAPVHIDAASLQASLQAMAASATSTHGVPCELEFSGDAQGMDQVTATHLYRIAQEAAANAAKHAHASRIEIRLEAHGPAFSLRVEDDGVGLPEADPAWGHLGLSIMRYRARIIGASLGFLSRPGGGTQVRCERDGATP